MPDENKKSEWRYFFKAVLIAVVVMIAVAVVGFGLLVGVCAFAGRR